jgi:hypothetical protein
MNPDTLLKVIAPMVPAGQRTAAGVALFVLGTVGTALASPDLVGVLPVEWSEWTPILQAWGGAVAALGLRAAKQL